MSKIFRSEWADVVIPTTNSLSEFVFSNCEKYGNRAAFVDGPSGRQLRFAEIPLLVRRFGAGLTKLGFKKGDTLAIYSLNCLEYVIGFHGVISVGGILTTCNPAYTAPELAHQVKDSGAQWLMTMPEFLDKAQEAGQVAGVRSIIVIGDATSGGVVSFDDVMDNDGSDFPSVDIKGEDVAIVPYSSGTSGVPKGVMLTNRNIIANLEMLRAPRMQNVNEDTVMVAFLPFYHIYAMVLIMNQGILQGAKVIIMPRFVPQDFLSYIEHYKITQLPLVPPVALFLAKDPLVDKYDISSIQDIICGAAPLSETLQKEVVDRTGVKHFRQAYGMTELSPVCHFTPLGEARYGSAGKVAPNMEAKVIDTETGAMIGSGTEGELCIRGEIVMKGYLGNPEATARTIDPDGWLHTGDTCIVDDEGWFYIVDRVKELIKYKGFQVAPAELEGILLTHPDIADCAVIGIHEEGVGELPKGYVQCKPNASLTGQQVMDFVSSKVAYYKKIRLVEFVDSIKKSASGKILRRLYRDEEREKRKSKL